MIDLNQKENQLRKLRVGEICPDCSVCRRQGGGGCWLTETRIVKLLCEWAHGK